MAKIDREGNFGISSLASFFSLIKLESQRGTFSPPRAFCLWMEHVLRHWAFCLRMERAVRLLPFLVSTEQRGC